MRTSKARLLLISFVVLATIGIALWALLFKRSLSRDLLIASGTVEATEAHLGFQAPGRIESILVREGDRVETGAELAILDRKENFARKQQAEAVVDAERVRLEDARSDFERSERLYKGGAVSRERHEKSLVAYTLAKSHHEQAEASLRVIEALLANMTIVAPFEGVVTIRHYEPGESVQSGVPVLTIMNQNDRWVRVYIPEDRIGAVNLGTNATITSDTYPNSPHKGEVIFIASEAEFTPKNVQTAEERVKLVYAVKVRIIEDSTHELKPGMPADVSLDLTPP